MALGTVARGTMGRLASCLALALLASAPAQAAARTATVGGRPYVLAAKCPTDRYDVALKLRPGPGAPGPVDLVFAASGPKDYYRLLIGPKGTVCSAAAAGREREIATAPMTAAALAKSAPAELLIRRAPDTLRVYANGRLLVECFDATHGKGMVALSGGGWTVESARHQKRDDVVFTDGFMRAEEEQELAPWRLASGLWRFHSVREKHEQARAINTSNPFSLGGRAESDGGYALVTAGHGFWDGYDVSASVCSSGAAAGLVWGYQSPQDYWLVRLSVSKPVPWPSRLELVRVLGVQAKTAASTYVTVAPGQWYRLRVETRGCRVRVYFDEWPVFDLTDSSLRGGQIGLYTEGQAETAFDDVDVQPTKWFRLDHPGALAGGQLPAKEWQWQPETVSHPVAEVHKGFSPTKPAALVLRADSARLSIGADHWRAYAIRARVACGPDTHWVGLGAGGGLLFRVGRSDGKGPWLVQWLQTKSKAAPRVIAQGPAPRPLGGSFDLELDLGEPGRCKAYLDGELVLRAQHDAQPGRPWLYGQQARGAAFADVAVGSSLDRHWESEASNELFVKDPFMTNWATSRGTWLPVSGVQNAYWHSGDCFGYVRVGVPLQSGMSLTIAGEDMAFGSGYAVSLQTHQPVKEAATTLFLARLTRKGVEVAHGTLTPGDEGQVFVERDGHYLTVGYAGEEVLAFRDPKPLSCTNLGLRASGEIDLAQVSLRRDHVMDYLFETAPWDWDPVGLWEVTNRFACQPRWGHMSGRSRGAVVLWNKAVCEGDVTVEYYVGLRMRQDSAMWRDQPGSYPRQGDFNTSIGTDGRRLDDGYSFLVYAWDPRWSERFTRILRMGKTVAETDQHLLPNTRSGSSSRAFEVPWMPRQSERPIHGAWYYIEARKRGGDLSLHCDGHRVLSHRDPKPIRSGRVAIWSQNNSIVLARAKISFQHRRVPCPIVPKPRAVPAAEQGGAPVQSSTHPGLACGFEAGLCGWESTGHEQGAWIEADPSTRAAGRFSLRLTNVRAGGDFGVRVPAPELDALHVAALQFQYRLKPDVRVNLYFDLDGEAHFLQFTGESASHEGMKRVAAIANVEADGQWHLAALDLGQALRKLHPWATALPLTNLRFGHFHEGYLTAAIGGNAAGATWHLDDFILATTAAGPARFAWSGEAGQGVTFGPAAAKPQAPQPAKASEAAFTPAKTGLYLCRVSSKQGKPWRESGRHAAFVQAEPLRVASVTPSPGSRWHGEPISIQFAPQDGCHPASPLLLTCNGTRIPVSLGNSTYHPGARRATVDAAAAGLTFGHEQRLDFQVQFRDAVASGAKSRSYRWHYIMDRTGDKRPPSPVSVSSYLAYETFEGGLGSWQIGDSPQRMKLALDSSTAAVGRRSAQVFNRTVVSHVRVTAFRDEFDAGRFPLLAFHYRIADHVKTDLVLSPRPLGWARQIGFTDGDTSLGRLCSMSGVVADGAWHEAQVDLAEALAAQEFHPEMFRVSGLGFADCGSLLNGPTDRYHVDEFRLIPVLSAAVGSEVAVSASDPSGIKGFSWHWSAAAKEDPDTQTDGSAAKLPCRKAPEGRAYFHVRAQDNAGNWGPSSHWLFLVDNHPPAIKPTGLWAKGFAASAALSLEITDPGPAQIDPKTLWAKVNGKRFDLDPVLTRCELDKGRTRWDWCLATGLFSKPVADGTAVQIELPAVADFAGNAAGPSRIDAKVSYAQDREAPIAPEVACSSRHTECCDTFSRSLGQWANWGGRQAGMPGRVAPDGRGEPCMRVTNLSYNGSFGVYARSQPFSLAKTPWVSFDYNFPKKVKVHFLVYVAGRWHGIGLTSRTKQSDYKTVGSVPGVVADGTWRHAAFNLRDLLHKGIAGGLKDDRARYITIAAYQNLYNSKGTAYYIDNFCIFGPGSLEPAFDVAGVDPSGIKAYAYVMDQSPGTVPAKSQPVASASIKPPALKAAGLHYLHVCVQDGAGNWSAPAHVPYWVENAPPPPKKPRPK